MKEFLEFMRNLKSGINIKKALILFTILMFIFTTSGCSTEDNKKTSSLADKTPEQNENVSFKETPYAEKYLPVPEITIDAIHKNAQQDTFKVLNSGINIAGEYFCLEIVFDRPVKPDTLKKYITKTLKVYKICHV